MLAAAHLRILTTVVKSCGLGGTQGSLPRARDGLLKLARVWWPDQPPQTLRALGYRTPAGNLAQEIDWLERAIYGEDGTWAGAGLWTAVCA
jgi:hypothetical protein